MVDPKVMKVGICQGSGGGVPDQINNWLPSQRKLMAAGIPPVVACIDNPGPIKRILEEAKSYPGMTEKLVLSFRVTGDGVVGGWDYVPYGAAPQVAAKFQFERHYEMWQKNFPAGLAWDLVWFSTDNEPNKDHDPAWYADYYMEMCRLALDVGVKLLIFGWASGTPEPEFWQHPKIRELLDFLAAHPDELGLALHEYSYKDSFVGYDETWFGEYEEEWDVPGWLLGRFLHIPKYHKISIFINESGYHADWIPDIPEQVAQEYTKVWNVYYSRGRILGLAVWRADHGRGEKDVHLRLNAALPNLANAAISYSPIQVPVDPPPVEPPKPPTDRTNLLFNGSFESKNWKDLNAQVQQPEGWEVGWNEGKNPYQTDDGSWWDFKSIEMVHFTEGRLPADSGEWETYSKDGYQTLKMFSAHKPFHSRVKQTIRVDEPGEFLFSPWVHVDTFEWHGKKVAPKDRNAAQIRVLANGEEVLGWTQLTCLQEWSKAILISTTTHKIELQVEFMCPFAISNNGFWLDDWQLIRVEVSQPEPEPEPEETLEQYLWRRSLERVQIYHDASLYKAILKDMMHAITERDYSPLENEMYEVYDGKTYVTQTAYLPGPTQEESRRAVYYAPLSDFNDVRVIDRVDLDEPEPEPPPSPIGGTLIEINRFVSQRDPRWRYKPMPEWETGAKTYGAWGCLITSYYNMALHFNLFGSSLEEFVKLAIEKKAMYRVDDALGLRWNTAAYALKTMFPDRVTGGDWKTNKNPQMEAAIIESIRKGIPVPARVDIDPATPRIDQHWPLVVGYQYDDTGEIRWIMQDPYSLAQEEYEDYPNPRPEFLDERYDIPGTDIQEAIFYQIDEKPAPPPVEPPETHKWDVFKAFSPSDGKGPRITLGLHTGGTEPMQLVTMNGKYTAFAKGENGNSWEGFVIESDGVYRTVDLSPDADSYYKLVHPQTGFIVPWLPRKMAIGEWYVREVEVQFYNKKDCRIRRDDPRNGFHRTFALLQDVYHDVTFPAPGMAGKVVNGPVYDILVCHSQDKTNWMERYWFAERIGLVQWWSNTGGHSVIVEITEGQEDLPVHNLKCLDVTTL